MKLGRFGLSSLLLALCCICSPIAAQDFIGTPVTVQHPKLTDRFAHWDVFRLDATALATYTRNEGEENEPLYLHLGQYHVGLKLGYNNLFADNYKAILHNGSTENDIPQTVRPYVGHTLGEQGRVRLTLGNEMVYGSFFLNGERINIQPLWYLLPNAPHDQFIVYRSTDVITDGLDMGCGTDHENDALHEDIDEKIEQKVNADNGASACYQVDLAIASDASMLSKYGNAGAVQAHNIAVLNDVEGDYTGNFNHDIKFNIVIQFISASNPWGSNADAGTYLSNFRNWGNGGGFGVTYDLAEMWTNIDLTGSTIGIAYLSALCTSNKYHVLQDFSSNAELLRCLTSHEIGHNFASSHDNCPTGGTVFIMCPFVSTSTEWSSGSASSISGHITSRINNGCLQACSSGPAPTPEFSWNPDPGCVNQPISFTSESTGNITTHSWTFPGGTPATSTQMNPTVTWATPGVKNVGLVLNTGTSTQATISKQVTILGTPTADFTHTVSGLTVTFNSTASNATSYEWDFGDGGFSLDEDPVYTYTEGNFYVVKLTVTGPCGTATKTISLNTAPTAGFTPSATTGCAPLAVSFQNNSSPNANTFLWQFPGGTPASSSQPNPVVVYQSSGLFSVTLTAFNSQGSAVATSVDLITVQNIPSSNFTFMANGLTVSFMGSSNTGTNFLWNFGNGATSTQQNPTYTYPVGGTYTVTFTATNACGNTTNTKVVELALPPTAAFTATPTSGCGPLTVNFTNSSSNATGYVWSFPGGSPSTSTATNVTVTYGTPGTYAATLTATNAAGPSTATQTITVSTVPNTGFSSVVNGATATFTNTSANGTSYFWNFGDGTNSSDPNPAHTYLNDGTYQVVLSALNACGTSTFTQTITITTPPTAAFGANTTSGCAPFTVQFNNASSSNATIFAWQFPGGSPSSSTLANPVVTYANPGQYSVVLTASNAAGSNTATQTNYITVNTAPVAGFSQAVNGYQATFSNTAAGATTFAWAVSNGATSALPNFTTIFATAGTYTVTLTAGNACGTSTAVQTVTIVASPTASFTALPTTGCNSLTVQFTNTSVGNPTSFAWQFPGGMPATSTLANPIVTYGAPGTYNVSLTATNSAGSGTASQTSYINVGTVPTAGFTYSTAGSIANFTNTSNGASAYSWAFGDGNSSTASNPSHTYAIDGVYTVVLTSTNACGTTTSTQTVTIATPPTAGFNVANANGCAPFTVTFNNISSSNATTFVWQFPGGNPTTSTAQNPTVTYANTGVYAVSLTASNAAGSSSSTQATAVTVGTVPTPGFVVSQNGATISFSNASTGATAYAWNFGDGGSSTTANPSHLYTNDGTYTVVLTATNGCGTATSTQVVTIVTPPIANFSATGNAGCAPLTVQFNNTSTANATSLSWLFPGGNPASSTATNPVVEYAQPGLYSVILTASNTQGNSTVTQTNFVVVVGAPAAGFQSAVAANLATFTNTSTGGNAYAWNFGDGGTSTAISPEHTYTNDGVYTVVLTVSNNCGTATSTQVVTIVTAPTAGFTTTNTMGCAPFTVQFSNTSSANATGFAWQFPGGTPSTSTDANPVVIYAQAGSFDVNLTVTNAAGSNTSMQSNVVIVNGLPTPLFTYQTGGLSAQFSNASFNATAYFWNFGDGGTSTDPNPTHDYAAPGTYTVTLRAQNNCGEAIYTTEVTIAGTAPIAAFTAGDQTTGCAPFEVMLTDQSVGLPTAWAWVISLNGTNVATSMLQNPTGTLIQPGLYDVSLTVTNLYGTNTIVKEDYIIVNGAPTAGFEYNVSTSNGLVAFNNTSTGAVAYQWTFGDGGTSTDASPVHTYTQSGTYTVTLNAINECGVSVFQNTITVQVVGVEDAAWVSHFRLFPNPSTGLFQLDMKGAPTASLRFDLCNALGQTLRSEVHGFGTGQLAHTFDYTELPAGTYLLRISDAHAAFVVKLTVVE